jgi:hypothetical protein
MGVQFNPPLDFHKSSYVQGTWHKSGSLNIMTGDSDRACPEITIE